MTPTNAKSQQAMMLEKDKEIEQLKSRPTLTVKEMKEWLSQDPVKLWIIAQDYKSIAQAIMAKLEEERNE